MFLFKYGLTAFAAAYPVDHFETIIVEPTSEHTHTLIYLHGLNGTWTPEYVDKFRPGGAFYDPNRKAVLPQAPSYYNSRVSPLHGNVTQWFDFYKDNNKLHQEFLPALEELNFC